MRWSSRREQSLYEGGNPARSLPVRGQSCHGHQPPEARLRFCCAGVLWSGIQLGNVVWSPPPGKIHICPSLVLWWSSGSIYKGLSGGRFWMPKKVRGTVLPSPQGRANPGTMFPIWLWLWAWVVFHQGAPNRASWGTPFGCLEIENH